MVSIEVDAVVVQLIDLTAGHTHESLEAAIPLTEFTDNDLETMKVGGLFRWTIGHDRSTEQTTDLVSQIKFLDYPKVTKSDFLNGRVWARQIVELIGPKYRLK